MTAKYTNRLAEELRFIRQEIEYQQIHSEPEHFRAWLDDLAGVVAAARGVTPAPANPLVTTVYGGVSLAGIDNGD